MRGRFAKRIGPAPEAAWAVSRAPSGSGATILPGPGLIAAGIVASTLLATALLTTAAGAAERGQITLRGTVPAVCTVALSASSATLEVVRGQSATPVATVEERCNAAAGYTVSVTSRNGGQLRQEGAASGVSYAVSYDQVSSNSGALVAVRAPTGAARVGTLAVEVPASPEAPAGDYVDVLTVSISAK